MQNEVFLKKVVSENEVTNGAKNLIGVNEPYVVKVKIMGDCDYLYHRWNAEAIEAKSLSSKNSKARKTDDIENFVYRNHEGFLCIPGEQLRMSIVYAAKFKQDPRSSRKSAMDLYKAGIIVLTPLASVGKKEWDYEDKRRVVIMRSSISRTRPALKEGWEAEFDVLVNVPEYIAPLDLHSVITTAGKLCGIGDFRPTYGRFVVSSFQTI